MLVQGDKAQLEWRTAVWLSNDVVGKQEILNKEDTHEKNRVAFTLPSRLIAKIYLFRTIFRGSGYAFSKDPDFSHVSDDAAFWDDINGKFYRKYNGLDRWHKHLAQLSASRKPIVGPTGREWLVLPEDDGKLKWTVFTNYPVQGTGADIVMVERVSLRNRLRSQGLRSKLVGTVHDSIIADCPDDEVETVARIMIEVANDTPKNFKKLFNVDMDIPFPTEIKIGHNLNQMEKYESNFN